jgi:hypothetical protein
MSEENRDDRDEFDALVPPLWQSIVALGEALPREEWDRVPSDLSTNLDHYLYDKPREEKRKARVQVFPR